MNLIGNKNETDEATANMTGISINSVFATCCNSVVHDNKWVIDSDANQHMTSTDSELVNIVVVSKLNFKVDHPNGSTAKIKKIGNLQMSESVTLFDVFVVPEFNVNLLSVHKLCKDNKCEVKFNEHNCSVQGLQSKVTVGTGSEKGGLYYYNRCRQGNNKAFSSVSKCFISKFTWHSMLGHPAEQCLNVLRESLNFIPGSLPPCEVCHKAKQTRDPFPLFIKST